MNAFYDPKFRRLLDWTEARRAGSDDTPIPFADDESVDAVMWIESFLDAADMLARIDPPASLRLQLRTSFTNHHRRGNERSIAALMLTLVADSRGDAELAGVRGLVPSDMQDTYQLLFRGGPTAVFVEVLPTSAVSVRITGQIVQPPGRPDGTLIIGRTFSGSRFAATSDEHGQFSLDSVPADVVSLEIDDGETVVGLELDLRAG